MQHVRSMPGAQELVRFMGCCIRHPMLAAVSVHMAWKLTHPCTRECQNHSSMMQVFTFNMLACTPHTSVHSVTLSSLLLLPLSLSGLPLCPSRWMASAWVL